MIIGGGKSSLSGSAQVMFYGTPLKKETNNDDLTLGSDPPIKKSDC